MKLVQVLFVLFVILAPNNCLLAQFRPPQARVHISGPGGVKGVLFLEETPGITLSNVVKGYNFGESSVRIVGKITGLTPGLHGFHVHEPGDFAKQGCPSTGPHFSADPNIKHGSKHDHPNQRHSGDLGNIMAHANGIAHVDLLDNLLALSPSPNNIIGKVFVIHEKADDLGQGGNDASKANGNAGARIACGRVVLNDDKIQRKAVKSRIFSPRRRM